MPTPTRSSPPQSPPSKPTGDCSTESPPPPRETLRGYFPGERKDSPEPPREPAPERPRRERPRVPKPRLGRLRGGPRLDWVIGITLGIVLGLGIITAFLILGSEETIDAPSISRE